MTRLTCDIFCKVIDNFGDIGVCWRLARQLKTDYAWEVQLWVDDLHTFSKLCSAVNPNLPIQSVESLCIRHWTPTAAEEDSSITIPDIVIEAFGCELPVQYIERMAARSTQSNTSSPICNAINNTSKNTLRAPTPIWIDLEYLSGEAWVPSFHALPSPHPLYPLTKTCFFPGLERGTGGVLKEKDLCKRREDFLKNPAERAAFWQALGISPFKAQAPNTTQISLFCYENPLLAELLATWSTHSTPITCFVPQGLILPAVARFMGQDNFPAGTSATKGQLTVHSLPFLTQNQYDQLLWLCDLNFARGEDSFVRAQWAQRPFIWHIYPQNQQAHLAKLEAALHHYTVDLEQPVSDALIQFWRAWNGAPGARLPDTLSFWSQMGCLQRHAHHWAQSLTEVGDLASNLVAFCTNQLALS